MADLKRRHTWKKWAPDVGENRELPQPALYLELATGITAEQLLTVSETLRGLTELRLSDDESLSPKERVEQVRAKMRAVYVEALGPFVRVHDGPHTVDGQPLATFEDYVALVMQRADWGVLELGGLRAALDSFNSIAGPDELFSPRRSGGARTTRAQSVERAGSKTVAP